MRHDRHNNQGFIALMTVLVVGAVAVSVGTYVLLGSIAGTRSSFEYEQTAKAKALADSCIEETLMELRESVYYSAQSTSTFANGLCTASTTGSGNTNRSIYAAGYEPWDGGTTTRRVVVYVSQIHPRVVISSWYDIAH